MPLGLSPLAIPSAHHHFFFFFGSYELRMLSFKATMTEEKKNKT